MPLGTLASPDAIAELDALVLVMVLTTLLHAYRTRNLALWSSGLLLGLWTEHASLRLGGTHCHASSAFLNVRGGGGAESPAPPLPHPSSPLHQVSDCSSLNACAYYIPWLYSCVVSARRLCGGGPGAKHLLPVVGGALFLG